MKQLKVLLPVILMLTLSSNIYAQSNITATAEVLQEITYAINGTQIDFVNLQTSFTSATIDPSSTAGDANVNSNATAARITVTGSVGETVLVTDPGTLNLAHSGGDVLDLATNITGATGDVTTDRGGAALTNGNELPLDGTNGNGTLWIGGTLTVGNDLGDGTGGLATGTYSTTFTLTLEYL